MKTIEEYVLRILRMAITVEDETMTIHMTTINIDVRRPEITIVTEIGIGKDIGLHLGDAVEREVRRIVRQEGIRAQK